MENSQDLVTRRPGRPKREEVTGTERRRRKGGTTHALAIPQAVKDKYPDMEFRWGRDDGNRMQQLTVNDDWTAVEGEKPIHGGRGETGGAMNLHLLMKPRKFMAEDMAEKLAKIKAIEQNALARPDAKTATERGEEMYSVPGNKI